MALTKERKAELVKKFGKSENDTSSSSFINRTNRCSYCSLKSK